MNNVYSPSPLFLLFFCACLPALPSFCLGLIGFFLFVDDDRPTDANPTPTRFLLECGAFTPGFGLNLESYNPFDASYKFLNTDTPKSESNPFDTSFRVPSSSVSVPNSVHQNQSLANEGQKQQYQQQQSTVSGQQQQRVFDRHPWADMMFDEVPMPMPHMSPGLSSASSTSSPPSPPLDSPPTLPSTLRQFPSTASESQQNTHSYGHDSMFSFDSSKNSEQISQYEFTTIQTPQTRNPATINPSQAFNEQIGLIHSGANLRSNEGCQDGDESDIEQPFEYDAHSDRYMSEYPEDSEMATEISGLHMQQDRESSLMSSASVIPMDDSQEAPIKEIKGRKAAPKATKVPKTKKTADIPSKKAKTSSKPSSRKRSSQEQESPEAKRQKFLERNRMAASKCREKKRLQTMKTISDADEITARNQQLHESLGELQEEVRFLKNQILAHRNCGCDVIQKFLQTSYDYNGSPSSPASMPMMQF